MSELKELIAEARDVAKWFRGERSVVVNVHDARFETLLDRLADALSAQQPGREQLEKIAKGIALREAQSLALHLAKRCYPEVPDFKVLDSIVGVLSQIDNMTTGLVRAPPAPQPSADTEQTTPAVAEADLERLVMKVLPPATIFVENADHLNDLRDRAKDLIRSAISFQTRPAGGEWVQDNPLSDKEKMVP